MTEPLSPYARPVIGAAKLLDLMDCWEHRALFNMATTIYALDLAKRRREARYD